MVTCAWCGTASSERGSEPPLTWTVSEEADGRRWYCDRCARENLRSIEGRLDSEWWG